MCRMIVPSRHRKSAIASSGLRRLLIAYAVGGNRAVDGVDDQSEEAVARR